MSAACVRGNYPRSDFSSVGGQVLEAEAGVGVKESGDQTLVLGRGDRAGRVDKHAART